MIKKTLSLRYDFAESEINDIAHTLTDCLTHKGGVVNEKQAANRKLNAEIKYWDRQIDNNSTLIQDGFEYRDVDCQVVYNEPVAGQKTITRLDNMDSWQEQMTLDEFDLFNTLNVPADNFNLPVKDEEE
jgi:hypothetical protein